MNRIFAVATLTTLATLALARLLPDPSPCGAVLLSTESSNRGEAGAASHSVANVVSVAHQISQ
jgi:hypothetical protein